MNELTEILFKSKWFSWDLSVNPHKVFHETIPVYLEGETDIPEDILNGDILIELTIYPKTSVGHYILYANSYDDILSQVKYIFGIKDE